MPFASFKTVTRLALALGIAGAASAVMVCRADSGQTPKFAPMADEKAAVTIKSYKFDPQTLEVKVGTTVTWTNQDSKDHTVSSGTPDEAKDAPLNGDMDGEGKTYSYTFKEAGEFPYYCKNHHGMRGKVVVK
jgi:plastocyanin